MKKHNTIIAMLLTAWSGAAQAGAYQSLDSITEAARVYVESQPGAAGLSRREYQVSKLDPRLQLGACTMPLQSKQAPGNPGGSTLTIAVSCASPKAWTLYVPVRVARYMTVLVSRDAQARGSRLSQQDLEVREVDTAGLRGVPLSVGTPYTGSQLKRGLQSNQVLTTDDICLICKGELVTVSARGPRLTVKIPGMATADGNLGQRIMVKNQSTQRLLQARVVGPGEVEIPL